jgi:hypothetical protein
MSAMATTRELSLPSCRGARVCHRAAGATARAWGPTLSLILGLWLGVSAAHAGASSASSLVFEGASASVGSLSTSVQASSQSAQRVAALESGDYRVSDVSAHSADSSQLRVQLVPAAASSPHAVSPADAARAQLVLPAVAVRAAALQVGAVLTLRERAYGFELAHGQPRRAFFLLLRDEALPDLQTRPVSGAAAVRL